MGWWGKFTGEDGARKAQEQQQALYAQAAAADPLAGGKYKDIQKNLVDDMAAGKNAAIDESQFNQTLKDTVTPQINSGFGGNMWSTARQKALQTGALDLRNDMTTQANNNRANVLNTLRGSTQGEQNILGQQAGAIQNTKRGWLDTFNQGLGAGANAAAIYKAAK